MTTPLKSDIDLFFEDPAMEPAQAGNPETPPEGTAAPCRKYGILYHLRRSADNCYQMGEPWPGVMCILAGIDLCAGFYAGTKENLFGKKLNKKAVNERWKFAVGSRYRAYIQNFFPGTSNQFATDIYGLRNTLMHSFGVVSTPPLKYRYVVDTQNPNIILDTISSGSSQIKVVNFHALKTCFEGSLINYRNCLGEAPNATSFQTMFNSNGWMLTFAYPSPAQVNPSFGPGLSGQGIILIAAGASGV